MSGDAQACLPTGTPFTSTSTLAGGRPPITAQPATVRTPSLMAAPATGVSIRPAKPSLRMVKTRSRRTRGPPSAPLAVTRIGAVSSAHALRSTTALQPDHADVARLSRWMGMSGRGSPKFARVAVLLPRMTSTAAAASTPSSAQPSKVTGTACHSSDSDGLSTIPRTLGEGGGGRRRGSSRRPRARAACITILVALRFSRLTPQVRALIRTPCQAGARPLRLQWLDYLLPSAMWCRQK